MYYRIKYIHVGVCAQSLSHVWLFVTPWTVACQAPLSLGILLLQVRILEWVAMAFSRGSSQLPNPGIKPRSPTLQEDSSPSELPGNMYVYIPKEGCVLKNWCFQIVVPEKILENPLDCKQIKLVNPKGNKPCVFTGQNDAEIEALILWPPDVNIWIIEKDPDIGKDWRLKGTGAGEDGMVR